MCVHALRVLRCIFIEHDPDKTRVNELMALDCNYLRRTQVGMPFQTTYCWVGHRVLGYKMLSSRPMAEMPCDASCRPLYVKAPAAEVKSTADTTDMGGAFRNVASSWRQRERDERAAGAASPKQQPSPSRRIGNLLSRKTADEWEDPDELIAEFLKSPPIAAIPDAVEDDSMPPPPPRESSRDYMREFTATDKKFHK